MTSTEEMLSVISELEQEIDLLKSKGSAIPQKDGFGSSFVVLSLNPLRITGILISEGVWKGVQYLYDELKLALPKFENLKGMVLHGHSQKYGDRIIGKLTKVKPNDFLKSLMFEAEITDEEAIKDVKNRVFDAVSIKVECSELDTSTNPPIGRGYIPYEWSLTSSPACETCLIFSVEELSKSNICDIKTSNLEEDNSNMSKPEDICESYEKPNETAIRKSKIKFECPICGKTFDTKKEFDEHWDKEEKEKYEREYYGYEYSSLSNNASDKDAKPNVEATTQKDTQVGQQQTATQQPMPQPQAQPTQQQDVTQKPQAVQEVEVQPKAVEYKGVSVEVSPEAIAGKEVAVPQEPKKMTLKEIRKMAKEKNISLADISADFLLKSLKISRTEDEE